MTSPNERFARILFKHTRPHADWNTVDDATRYMYRMRAQHILAEYALPTPPDNENLQACMARAWNEGHITGIHDALHPYEPGRTINPYTKRTSS